VIFLSIDNGDEVFSPQDIEPVLVDPHRRMRIISGIARPEFSVNDDEHDYPEHCVVSLGVALPDFIQATCQVGLASVSNNNTGFHFGLNDCWVVADPASGELKLHVTLGARGENTSISRFGFQVVALFGSRITGVSGRIRWSGSLFDPTPRVKPNRPGGSQIVDVSRLIKIYANVLVPAPPGPPGSFGTSGTLTSIGFVTPTGAIHQDGDDFWVAYAFDHLPLGVKLFITGSEVSKQFPGDIEVDQISGPSPVVLTPAHLHETVDFRIITHHGPA
jgi:hypothetical protein